jgi:hypothetical protein
MTNFWQSVIFSIENDDSTASSILGQEGGVDTVSVRNDFKPLFFDEGSNIVMSMEFLICQLWVLVDLQAGQWRSCDAKRRVR